MEKADRFATFYSGFDILERSIPFIAVHAPEDERNLANRLLQVIDSLRKTLRAEEACDHPFIEGNSSEIAGMLNKLDEIIRGEEEREQGNDSQE